MGSALTEGGRGGGARLSCRFGTGSMSGYGAAWAALFDTAFELPVSYGVHYAYGTSSQRASGGDGRNVSVLLVHMFEAPYRYRYAVQCAALQWRSAERLVEGTVA